MRQWTTRKDILHSDPLWQRCPRSLGLSPHQLAQRSQRDTREDSFALSGGAHLPSSRFSGRKVASWPCPCMAAAEESNLAGFQRTKQVKKETEKGEQLGKWPHGGPPGILLEAAAAVPPWRAPCPHQILWPSWRVECVLAPRPWKGQPQWGVWIPTWRGL